MIENMGTLIAAYIAGAATVANIWILYTYWRKTQ